MSLAKLKSKESKGGKQKSHLPKLKAILANPKKNKCPTLDKYDMDLLQTIFQTAIKNSEMSPRKFVSYCGICLGLESSLRCINNYRSSCVFITLSIKPIHIVSLIARNAEVKNPLQPIFAVPNLEDFTEKIFGIRALCLVLPKELHRINNDLAIWLDKQKLKKVQSIKEKEKHYVKSIKQKKKKLKESKENDVKEIESINQETQTFTGDFISFDKVDAETMTLEADPNEALKAFAQMMKRLPKATPSINEQVIPMKSDNKQEIVTEPEEHNVADSVDFLDNYSKLVVHKIKPNPNKKPKKKRNKIQTNKKIFKK